MTKASASNSKGRKKKKKRWSEGRHNCLSSANIRVEESEPRVDTLLPPDANAEAGGHASESGVSALQPGTALRCRDTELGESQGRAKTQDLSRPDVHCREKLGTSFATRRYKNDSG